MHFVRPLQAAALPVFLLAIPPFDAPSGTLGPVSYAAVAMVLMALGVIVTRYAKAPAARFAKRHGFRRT